MGFCSGDNLSKVSEEKSCLPGAQTAAMPPVAIPPVAMRVPPLHPCGPSEDVSAALAFPTQAAVLSGSENFPSSLLHLFHDDGSDEHQKGLIHCNSGSKRLLDGASPAEEILPAKKIRLSTPEKSILKKTKFRRRFSTPRRTFFTDNATVLEYATSHPPCEISYLMRVQSNMSLCFDDGVWFKKTVYSSDESP